MDKGGKSRQGDRAGSTDGRTDGRDAEESPSRSKTPYGTTVSKTGRLFVADGTGGGQNGIRKRRSLSCPSSEKGEISGQLATDDRTETAA